MAVAARAIVEGLDVVRYVSRCEIAILVDVLLDSLLRWRISRHRFSTKPWELQFQTLQFDFDPAVLSLSSIVVVLSAVFIVFVQRVVGLDLIVPGARR